MKEHCPSLQLTFAEDFRFPSGHAQSSILLWCSIAYESAQPKMVYIALFPQTGQFIYQVFRFIRYAILGLWICAGAPWVFLKIRIAGR